FLPKLFCFLFRGWLLKAGLLLLVWHVEPFVLFGVAKVRRVFLSASGKRNLFSFLFLHFTLLQPFINKDEYRGSSLEFESLFSLVSFKNRLAAPAGLLSRSFDLGVQR
ncbi:MAG: hypothetical protein ACO1O1_03065, partial [Adhaeribacter sp.]